MWAGEKKCVPTTSPGLAVVAEIASTSSVEVLVAMIAPGLQMLTSSRATAIAVHGLTDSLLVSVRGGCSSFTKRGSRSTLPVARLGAKSNYWTRMAQKRTIEDTWRHLVTLAETIERDVAPCSNPD